MKRLIALMLVLAFSLGLTACSQGSSEDLMKDVPAKAVDVLPDMDAEQLLQRISVFGSSKPVWRKGRIP